MKNYVIIREGSLLRAHCLNDKDERIMIPFRSIRGAIAWPTRLAPMYFMIVAQEALVNEQGRFQLHLLHEQSGPSPAKMFADLIQFSRKYSVEQSRLRVSTCNLNL